MELSGGNKFNILHVVSRLPVGGVENMLLKVITGYDGSRFNASVCCIKEGGEIAEELNRMGYKVEVLNRMKGHAFDPGAVGSLYRLLKRDKIHVLRTHQYHAGLYGRIAGILARVPVIVPSFHDNYRSPDRPKIHRRAINYLLGTFSDALIAVSTAVESDIVRYDRVSPGKIKVIYNGITTQIFDTALSKKKARDIFNIPDDRTIIGTLGRVTQQKGHCYLIKAASRLQNVCIVIAGNGPLMDELKNLASSLNVCCVFTGQITPEWVPMLLNALDIFCFPSLWEGFGTSIVEAMASGLPIIASDIPPHREVLGEVAVLTPPGDSGELARALKMLIDNHPLRDAIAQKAKERARLFSIENTVKAYEELFENILKKKGLL